MTEHMRCPKCRKMTLRLGSRTPGGRIRWECREGGGERKLCYQTTEPLKPMRTPSGSTKKPQKVVILKRTLSGKTTLLITAAQNATPVHKDFMKALEAHANFVGAADILAIPFRYKNPTSRFGNAQETEEWWDPAIMPYLCNQRKQLNSNLILMGDIKIQATAGKPLAQMDALSHSESGIFGHPKLQLRTIPTYQDSYPKIIATTGACTVQNYTDTKLGKIGDFHHTIGAALVEIKGKKFHLRQLNAQKDTGEYIDLDRHFTAAGSIGAARAQAVVLGDWHKDFTLPAVERATFGVGGIVPTLRPSIIAWHDLADFYSVNPHHAGDWVRRSAKFTFDRFDARAELERACQYVSDHTPGDTVSIIVPSNHNDFLARWMLATDPRSCDRFNRKLWCETAVALDESAALTQRGIEYVDAFIYWARKYFAGCPNVRVLERGESFSVAGVELGLHFDKGPNGSRGSLQNLRRIGTKIMGGHGHGPGIDEGGYQVGTATGPLEYGIGSPSGWLNTHGAIDALGKRTLLNIIGNQWRLHE